MIVAGLILLTIGCIDIVRRFAPRPWIGFVIVAVLMLVLGGMSDSLLAAVMAALAGAAWIWSMPADRPSPLTFWPAVALAAVSVGTVVWGGARSEPGILGSLWHLDSPFGPISFDLAILVLGLVAFLLESGNLVVRAALDGEHTWQPQEVRTPVEKDAAIEPSPDTTDPETVTTAPATVVGDPRAGFKGGRLIGPLERVIVFLLTLAGAYPLLAAMLAAKGIVRFPEISRDGETGARAEYFLVGSLVSWVIALSAAFLVWWSTHS